MLKYGIVLIASLLINKPDTSKTYVHPTVNASPVAGNGLHEFLSKIGFFESENNPRAVNRFGMLGKYQFNPKTLKEIGINVSKMQFLNNEAIQDSAMVRYLRANRDELKNLIARWSGKTYQGIPITESGILAGAHFSGTLGVWAFFYPEKYSKKQTDANGASVAMYIRKFGNFSLGL